MFEVGPALFGPSLGKDIADITGELHVLSGKDGSGMGILAVTCSVRRS